MSSSTSLSVENTVNTSNDTHNAQENVITDDANNILSAVVNNNNVAETVQMEEAEREEENEEDFPIHIHFRDFTHENSSLEQEEGNINDLTATASDIKKNHQSQIELASATVNSSPDVISPLLSTENQDRTVPQTTVSRHTNSNPVDELMKSHPIDLSFQSLSYTVSIPTAQSSDVAKLLHVAKKETRTLVTQPNKKTNNTKIQYKITNIKLHKFNHILGVFEIRSSINVALAVSFFHCSVQFSNVNGSLPSGSFCCILGPSGSGKSSFLDVLAGLVAPAHVTGTIQYNNQVVDMNNKNATGVSCYVTQEDHLLSILTVQQTFDYAAELHQGSVWSATQRKQRVAELIDDLGLTTVADTKIGDIFFRGLSGGQKRR